MRVWRVNEMSDGWFPDGIDVVPSVTGLLVAVATIVLSIIGVSIIAAATRLGPRH